MNKDANNVIHPSNSPCNNDFDSLILTYLHEWGHILGSTHLAWPSVMSGACNTVYTSIDLDHFKTLV